jgi:hypothetical protein
MGKVIIAVLLVLPFCALFGLLPTANAQTVNENIDAAFAVGKWKESDEVDYILSRTAPKPIVLRSRSGYFNRAFSAAAFVLKGFDSGVRTYLK